MNSIARIPLTDKKRVVIIGGGFAGLKLARTLSSRYFQVVLIDKNNFHQFQPLLYQVATSGLEPSAIAFPLRKIFQNRDHVHFRVAELISIEYGISCISTSIGTIKYDYLVLASGANTNYFGNKEIRKYALSMKSVSDAIYIRNIILENYEKALSASNDEEEGFMNIVIVGGGPTGVELAGALAEMRKYILPKDYPELDFEKMNIYLMEGSSRLVGSMSEYASTKVQKFLESMGVQVFANAIVKNYDGKVVLMEDGEIHNTATLLWAAGITVNPIKGLPGKCYGRGGRVLVNQENKMLTMSNIYAIGDIAMMVSNEYQDGHPQVAQPAIQQGKHLAINLRRIQEGKPLIPFQYSDKGALATIGRNKAVADLSFGKFSGFVAWMLWLFVHLMSLVGKKNRLFVFFSWAFSYFTYDKSFRLLIRPKQVKADN